MKSGFKSLALGLSLLAVSTAVFAGAAESVSVDSPYARAVPPGQKVSAAFMGLKNGSDTGHALVAAESPVAMMVELHEHTMQDGMMAMREVEKIDLPAGASVSLQPGGLHVMLMGLKRQLKPGEQIEITLVFDDGSKSKLEVPVQKIGAMMKKMKH